MKETKTTRFSRVMTVVLALALIFVFAAAMMACGDDDTATHTHTLQKVERVDPTCTEPGTSEHWVCTDPDCGLLFSDAEGETEVTAANLVVAALGHEYELEVEVAEYFPVGTVLTNSDLTFKLVCVRGDDEIAVTSGVTVDLSEALVAGDNDFTASYETNGETYECEFTVIGATVEGVTVELADADQCFHENTKITKDDLVVTAVYDVDDTPVEITAYTITDDVLTAGTFTVEVSYSGETDDVEITVNALTFVEEVAPTLENTGAADHYVCPECGQLFDEDFNEVEGDELIIPKLTMIPLSVRTDPVGNNNIYYGTPSPSVGAAVAQYPNGDPLRWRQENNNGFWQIGGDENGGLGENGGYGEYTLTFTLSVEETIDTVLCINTNVRHFNNKVSDVYSFTVNGEEITLTDDQMLPYNAGSTLWHTQRYTEIGKITLLAGQDNIIVIKRFDLHTLYGNNSGAATFRGNYTYNFYGLGFISNDADAVIEYVTGEDPEPDARGDEFENEFVFEKDKGLTIGASGTSSALVWGNAGSMWIDKLSGNRNATFKVTVYADAAGQANLRFTSSQRNVEAMLTRQLAITVNGEAHESDTRLIIRPEGNTWGSSENDASTINLGYIELVEGENVIEFTVVGSLSPNVRSITIRSDAGIGFEPFTEPEA